MSWRMLHGSAYDQPVRSREHAALKTSILMAILIAIPAALLASEPVVDSRDKQAAMLANEFVGLLKPQLKQALDEGGPANAIAVCADVAPRITDSLTVQSGWTVRRVSLKARNASRAVPDHWEKAVLLEFDRRQAAGAEPAELHYAEVVGGRYRYMQAQVVEPVCLVCHGKGLAEEVTQVLREYYPDDSATGYSLGQVRGAISLSPYAPGNPN